MPKEPPNIRHAKFKEAAEKKIDKKLIEGFTKYLDTNCRGTGQTRSDYIKGAVLIIADFYGGAEKMQVLNFASDVMKLPVEEILESSSNKTYRTGL